MKSLPLYFLKTLSLLLIFNFQLSGQNVGIGTTFPSAKLHLKSTIQNNTSLDLDFETGAIDPANNLGDNDWYITSTDGYNSVKSVKAPLIFNSGENALLAYFFNMSEDKEITVSFDYKYDDPTGQVAFSISANGFSFVPPSAPAWKFYSTTFISQSTSDALKISVNALQDEAFPIVHIDNIMITYPDGHVLKIEDGTEANGHFLQSDSLGHTEWYDLRGEMDQKINDKSLDLEFDTIQNALGIENGNFVLIPALKNDFGKSLQLLQSEILVSPGMSLHLPSVNSSSPSFHFDADNSTMDWGISNSFEKGTYSTRWGNNTTASNNYDTAWGESTVSSGGWSTAWGLNNWALGHSSTSWGFNNTISGQHGTAWGSNNTSSGLRSTTWGQLNEVTEENSTSFGFRNHSIGMNSTSWGQDNTSSGSRSTVWGELNEATGENSTSFGEDNLSSGDWSTSWGEGNTGSGLRSTVWGELNEATGENSTSFGEDNLSSGKWSTSWGVGNTGSGSLSTIWGELNEATGENSTSFGKDNNSGGTGSTTFGIDNNNQSQYATVWGQSNEIHWNCSVATVFGGFNYSDATYSLVSGLHNNTYSYIETAFGRYNNSPNGSSNSWDSDDMLFSIGNGTSETNRKNALSVLKNGNVGIGIIAPTYDLHLENNSAAKPGNGEWTIFSDRRLKKDISLFTDGLDIISAIEPIWYTYNGLAGIPEGTFVGTIAQDLEEIAPYMVSEFTHKDDEGNSENYKAVNYSAMNFVLINAIKEQQALIESQQETIVRQQEQIDEILRLLK